MNEFDYKLKYSSKTITSMPFITSLKSRSVMLLPPKCIWNISNMIDDIQPATRRDNNWNSIYQFSASFFCLPPEIFNSQLIKYFRTWNERLVWSVRMHLKGARPTRLFLLIFLLKCTKLRPHIVIVWFVIDFTFISFFL